MDFALSANQESIRDAIGKICTRFDDAYWLKKDKEGGYPADFHRALADAGWLGICIPEEYGGSGLGITDAAIMMRTIAESGAGMSGSMSGSGNGPVGSSGSCGKGVDMTGLLSQLESPVPASTHRQRCRGLWVRRIHAARSLQPA